MEIFGNAYALKKGWVCIHMCPGLEKVFALLIAKFFRPDLPARTARATAIAKCDKMHIN